MNSAKAERSLPEKRILAQKRSGDNKRPHRVSPPDRSKTEKNTDPAVTSVMQAKRMSSWAHRFGLSYQEAREGGGCRALSPRSVAVHVQIRNPPLRGAESVTFWILSMTVLAVSFDLEINCVDRWG
jgi:hypothetical protein